MIYWFWYKPICLLSCHFWIRELHTACCFAYSKPTVGCAVIDSSSTTCHAKYNQSYHFHVCCFVATPKKSNTWRRGFELAHGAISQNLVALLLPRDMWNVCAAALQKPQHLCHLHLIHPLQSLTLNISTPFEILIIKGTSQVILMIKEAAQMGWWITEDLLRIEENLGYSEKSWYLWNCTFYPDYGLVTSWLPSHPPTRLSVFLCQGAIWEW